MVGIVLAAAGCADQPEQIETLEPTALLIPATPTVTPSPIPPTPTSDVTEAPGLVIPIAPTAADTAIPSDAPLIDVDPIAGELVFIAQGLVADETGLPTRRIRLVSIEPYLWRDSSLGCPIPGQINSQLEIPG